MELKDILTIFFAAATFAGYLGINIAGRLRKEKALMIFALMSFAGIVGFFLALSLILMGIVIPLGG